MSKLNPYPIEEPKNPHGPGGDGHDSGDESSK